ncbi:hypothetical protein [Streptomyces sp. NBC_01198]|uniref:hypothetical protein n=1 Tax=Streptomyces sp. NBC_01198 TaxID=2903769 RepID=UPI002E127BA7|nr:hypothetical protein OG702_18360 [Streptomyces sp. NBC_01198]
MHMTTAPHLLNEDRPDFEHVLDEALRIVLDEDGAAGPAGPTGTAGSGLPLNSEQLRTLALAAAEQISVQAADEYDVYRTIRAETREAVREAAQSRDSRAFGYAAMGVADGAGSGAGLAAVIAVLTPLLAGAAAVIFLLIGYSMAAVHPQPAIASPLRTAGWFFAAVTAASIVLGGIGLLLTALRTGSTAIHDSADRMPPEVVRAREAWHQALLDRGLLPFLDDALNDTTAPVAPVRAPSVPRMPRLGYSRPDFSSPQDPQPRAAGPRFSSPDFSSPDFGSPDFGGPDHAPE